MVLKRLLSILFVGIVTVATQPAHGQAPFQKGVNLSGWFQAPSVRQVQFTKYTEQDFDNIKQLGCDVIRLPINLHAMTSGAPDYVPDPLFLDMMDQVVTWCEDRSLHLILDNHTFDPAVNTDPAIEDALVKVWTQMASHYKDRGTQLYYEVLNEPHGIADAQWGAIQQAAINAIRAVDTKHTIIVGAANWNSLYNLKNLPVYTDNNLLYTFHFYDPFLFTHQGASWTDPALTPLAGVPFPYEASKMPAVPTALRGTWVEQGLVDYRQQGTAAAVRAIIDEAVAFRQQRQVNLYCGEFGVYIPNSDNTARVNWYQIVRQYLETKNIAWTSWDYQGGFGLFDKNSNEAFDYDLNEALLTAMGLTVPPQKVYRPLPRTTGFILYDDYIGPGIVNASDAGGGELDFYGNDAPAQGKYAVRWANVGQYNAIAFDLKPDADLSLLPKNNYVLTFRVKGNVAGIRFDVRFIDTKRDAADHPWRMGVTIGEDRITWDGAWNQLTIALSDFQEKGSWDNAWYEPAGKFDWSAIDRIEIVPEHQSMAGVTLWLDDIRIDGEPIEIPTSNEAGITRAEGLSVYPNPGTGPVQMRFAVGQPGLVQFSLHDLAGREVLSWREDMQPGTHIRALPQTSSTLAAGTYIVTCRQAGAVHRTTLLVQH